MDGSSSRPRPHNPPLPPTPTLYQVPSTSNRQRHYRSLLQDHPLESSSSPALPPIPSIPHPPSYQQLYPGIFYTPPFVPGLDPSADPIQHQPRVAQGQFVNVPEWQPDHLVRSCPICDSPFTLFFRRHHCRKCGRVVCAQCSANRLSLPSSSVVRPPGEVFTPQPLDGFGGLPSSQWNGGPGSYNSPGTGASNRHSWAGSITSPVERNSPGFFDWGPNDVSSNGIEDVRVCSDCYAGCPPNENRGTSATGVSIHRTWNGSSSPNPNLHGRPSASGLWATPGVDTPDAIGRRRRQSLQGGRSLPYNYDPSTPPTFPNRSTYIPETSMSGSNYNLPPPVPTSSSHPQHYGPPYSVPPHLQAKYSNNPNVHMGGVSGSSRQASSGVRIPSGHFSQHPQPYHETSSQPQPVAPERLVRLKETDFCPICTLPLPPRDPETGDESEREKHIQDCIRRHEAPNSPRGANNAPSTAASSHTGVAGSTPAEMSVAEFLNQSKVGPGKPSGRMVVYKAREEDTWDYGSEDGQNESSGLAGNEPSTAISPPPLPSSDKNKHRKKAECVICFEEFEVGEAIARLECLCRYHKSCIREWFDRKGNGDCPVHAVRE